jgi:hypothetical protein
MSRLVMQSSRLGNVEMGPVCAVVTPASVGHAARCRNGECTGAPLYDATGTAGWIRARICRKQAMIQHWGAEGAGNEEFFALRGVLIGAADMGCAERINCLTFSAPLR